MKNILGRSVLACALLLLSGCMTTGTQDARNNNSESHNKAAAKYNTELGLGYLKRGDMQRAKLKLLRAIQQDPTSPVVYGAMAYFQEMTGNMKEADEFYKKAMKLAPGKGAALNNYGAYLCREGQYKQSINYFLRATKDPAYLKPPAAYENAGLCAKRIPDLAQAKKYFKLALNNDPRRPTALLELAEMAYHQKDYKVAQTYLITYSKIMGSPSAASTWLQYQIATKQHNSQKRAEFASLLAEKFKSSSQYRQLKSRYTL